MPPYHERSATVLQLRHRADRGRLFAIIDATDTPSVPRRAGAVGPTRAVSLYQGRAEEELFAIAPYLFQVDPPTLDWIAAELWSEPWGIFALADQTLDDLRRHFRRFLVVQSPEGESWYFRFYDPRVLEKYLATATAAEGAAFFGPLQAFAVTNTENYGVRVFAPGPAPTPAGPKPVVHR